MDNSHDAEAEIRRLIFRQRGRPSVPRHAPEQTGNKRTTDVLHKPDKLICQRQSANPFVVTVQSSRFRDSSRRVVVPLLDGGMFGGPDSDVCPRFWIEDREVVLDPLRITNVPRDVLGPAVGSLVGEEDRALDILLSRAWR